MLTLLSKRAHNKKLFNQKSTSLNKKFKTGKALHETLYKQVCGLPFL